MSEETRGSSAHLMGGAMTELEQAAIEYAKWRVALRDGTFLGSWEEAQAKLEAAEARLLELVPVPVEECSQ